MLLVIIFGSFAAASLPLAIGVTAILGAFTALRGFTYVTDVSIFAVNIVTIIGLGLAIDYGLFMVSRFREEIRAAGGRKGRRGRRWPARWRPPAGRWRSPGSPSRSRWPAC